jgi:hypothetical protein
LVFSNSWAPQGKPGATKTSTAAVRRRFMVRLLWLESTGLDRYESISGSRNIGFTIGPLA